MTAYWSYIKVEELLALQNGNDPTDENLSNDEVMFITQQGMVLRTSASRISLIGRNTQGVRLIDMEDDDRAVSLARLEEQEEPESTPGPTGAPESGSDTTRKTEATE